MAMMSSTGNAPQLEYAEKMTASQFIQIFKFMEIIEMIDRKTNWKKKNIFSISNERLLQDAMELLQIKKWRILHGRAEIRNLSSSVEKKFHDLAQRTSDQIFFKILLENI